MMLDPEELKRQREEKKAKRQAKRKKTIRLLAAGAVLLVAVIVLVVLIGRGGTSAPADPTDTPTQPPTQDSVPSDSQEPTLETVPPDTTVPIDPTTVIHFVAGGDLNITDNTVASGGSDYDYTQTFLDVAPLLAGADLTTVNFEGNLCGAPYGSSASAPQNLAYALRKAGVDMLQLANSYAIHRGVSGLRTTIDNVRAAGIEPLGVFADSTAYSQSGGFTIFEVEGVKVAVVAFTKGMLDGTALPPGNESMVNVLYTDYDSTYQKVNTAKITSVLNAVAAEKPDVTIALLHWGSEYNDTLSKTQTTIKDLLLENGVDAIIGTHPHRVQKMEYDAAKGTFVAYSLGDFFGNASRSGSEYSVLLDLEITKNNLTGITTITGYSYTPLFTVAEEGEPARVVRIREAMAAYESNYVGKVSEATYNAMAYALERIEARVKGS